MAKYLATFAVQFGWQQIINFDEIHKFRSLPNRSFRERVTSVYFRMI